jgi:glycosyltransferase involved in cell wall biosynthesis
MLESSIIVTTYNWPEALRLMLLSITGQSLSPSEVIVADDGSGPDTAEVVKEVLGEANLKWRHVYHAHKGVRQSRIKNLAIGHSKYPYLIFVDQDTVLHPGFVADHLSMAQEGVFLQGKRSLLPESYTKKILADGRFRAPSPWSMGLGNRKNTLRSPALGRLLARPKKFETALRGCNLSGREDSDFCYRLFHAGIKMKFLWFMALQYHLYHGSTSNWDRERLDGELQKNLEERRVKALKGFSQLSPEGEVIAASDGF